MKKKKKSPKLLILYKDGSMLEVSEKKLEPAHMKKAKYLLVPIDKKPNAYWCVRPSKMWFASKYIVDMKWDACLVDFEESLIENFGDLPSHFETNSMIAFANYLCTLYKVNGYCNVIEEGLGDLATELQMFTPSKIRVITFDDQKNIICDIETEEFHYQDGYSDTANEIIFQLEKQAESLDDFLLEFGSSKSGINCLPMLIEVDFNQMAWAERKKITKWRYNGYKLFRIDDFGAYFLGSDDIWNRILRTPGVWMRIYGLDANDGRFMSHEIGAALHNCDKITDRIKIVLSEACDNDDIDSYVVRYHLSVADPQAYLKWILFSEDIIGYTVLMTYIIANYNACVNIDDIKILIFTSDTEYGSPFTAPDSLMCSQSEALLGKIRQYLLNRIYKEENYL